MRRIANAEMRDAFLGWQCRIRQIAMREYGGQPLAGMRPSVSTRKGKSLSPGLVSRSQSSCAASSHALSSMLAQPESIMSAPLATSASPALLIMPLPAFALP